MKRILQWGMSGFSFWDMSKDLRQNQRYQHMKEVCIFNRCKPLSAISIVVAFSLRQLLAVDNGS